MLINNLDQILNDSMKYIAKRTNTNRIEVFETYLKVYDKITLRPVYKTQEYSLTKQEEQNFKLEALTITGRYYRRHAK